MRSQSWQTGCYKNADYNGFGEAPISERHPTQRHREHGEKGGRIHARLPDRTGLPVSGPVISAGRTLPASVIISVFSLCPLCLCVGYRRDMLKIAASPESVIISKNVYTSGN